MDHVETVSEYDVVVVGHGVSGLSAGISAHERGANTVILEKSPKAKRGGHTRHAGGLFRFPLPDPERAKADFGLEETPERYTEQDFMDDLMDVSDGRADEDLCTVLVENAPDAIEWLTGHGVSWHVVDHSDEPGFGTTVGSLQADGQGKGVVETLSARGFFLPGSAIGEKFGVVDVVALLTFVVDDRPENGCFRRFELCVEQSRERRPRAYSYGIN